MAKRPADRYQSAAEMLADLAKIRASLQSTLGTIGDENAISLPKVEETSKLASGSGVALSATSAATASSTLPLLTGRLFRPVTLLLTCLVFALVGAVLGWSTPPELPGDSAQKLPGLAIEPRWSSIPRQDLAEEQYRYAQLFASDLDLSAAWLAVPGLHAALSGMGVAGVSSVREAALPPGRPGSIDRVQGGAGGPAREKTADQELARIIDWPS